MAGIIYMYTSPSGKSYIGQTWNESARKNQHRLHGSKSIFHQAIKKYTFDNFIYEILHFGIESQNVLNCLEEIEIKSRDTIYPNGYNMCISGSGGFLSDSHKKRISESHKGKKMPESVKIKLIEKNTGRPLSDDHKKRLSIAMKGRKHTEEFKLKIGRAHKGKKLSSETKEKLSKSHMGKSMPLWLLEKLRAINKERKISQEQKNIISACNKNRIWKQESKDKLSKIYSKKIRCIETGVIYVNAKDASIKNNFKCPSALNKCAQGKVSSSYGLHWEYIND